MTISRSDINSRLWEIANTDANGNITGITVSNAVAAASFTGNGSNLSSITGANVTGTVANATYALTTASANTATTVTAAAQSNITSVGTLTSLTVNGNATLGAVANIHITGGSNGQALTTDGSGNLAWTTITGGGNSANANYANFAGTAYSVDGANVTGNVGTSYVAYFVDGSNVGGQVANAIYAVESYTSQVTYSVDGANVSGAVANANSANFSTHADIANTVSASAQPNITSLGTLGNLNVTDHVTSQYYAFPASDAILFGAGTHGATLRSGLNGAVTVEAYDGTSIRSSISAGQDVVYFNTGGANVAINYDGNVTGIHELSAISLLGDGGNISNITAANITGEVANATYANSAETVIANAQPNITSVGTLANLSVGGTITATGNVTGQYFIGDGSQLVGLTPALQTYMFANVASDISGYYQMTPLATFTAGNVFSVTTSVGTTETLMGSFATPTGFPNITSIPAGVFQINFETQRTSGGTNVTYYCYAKIFKRAANGTETQIDSSDNTTVTTSQQLIQQITAAYSSTIIPLLSTDRIIVKIYGVASATANISLRWDDDTNTFMNMPVPPASIATYLPYVGATANLNLGNNSLTTTSNITSGNANLGNLATANYITGTLTTAAQPNITSVGTLSSASITGNVSAGNANLGNLTTANYFTGTLTTAAQPNITSLGTLANLTSNGTVNFTNASNVTLGNAANLRITGGSNGYSLLTNGSGTVAWTAPKKYQREWHIDPANGVDDTLAGSYDRPFLTLAYALTKVGNTGEVLYLHAGTYTDDVSITQLNVDIAGTGATTGGIINVTGNVDIASTASSVRLWGINFANLTHSGGCSMYLKNSIVNGTLSTTSNNATYCTEVTAQAGVSVTGTGTASFDGGYLAGLTVNNASVTVSVSNNGSLAVTTLTAGILLVDDCNIYAANGTSNAIAAAAGSFAYIYNSRIIGGGAAGRVSLAGYWSINNTVYDRANSTLSVTNLGTVSYSDAISVTGNLTVGYLTNLGGVANVTITGGSNGQYLKTNGSGVLSFGTVTVPNVVNGNSNVTITANGNVTTYVAGNANARMTVTSTGANIAGTANVTGNTAIGGNLTSIGIITSTGNVNQTGFLVGNGAVSNVALGYMPTAGTAAEMAIRDYSTVATTMYFDAGMGSNATGSQFRFRGSNAYTTYANIDQYGISLPTRPAFRVYGSGTTSNLTTTVNTNGILNSNNWAVDYTQGSGLNGTTGIFTAPVAGLYSVHLIARVSNASSAQIAVVKNYATTNAVQAMWEAGTNCSANHFGVSSIAKLAAGDTLVIKVLLGQINFDSNDSWAVAYLG